MTDQVLEKYCPSEDGVEIITQKDQKDNSLPLSYQDLYKKYGAA